MPPTLIRWGNDYASTGLAGPPIAVPWGTGSPYPQTLGGVTLGVSDALGAITVVAASAWVSGDDALARGRWRVPNSGTARRTRIDLAPLGGPGEYRIRVSAVASSFQNSRWRVRDGVGGTDVVDVSWVGTDAAAWGNLVPASEDQFVVLNTAGAGIVNAGALDADILDPALPFATRTFSATEIEIVNGGHAGGSFSSDLSFITIEKVAPAFAPGARVLSVYYL